jgi:hypothetical protein
MQSIWQRETTSAEQQGVDPPSRKTHSAGRRPSLADASFLAEQTIQSAIDAAAKVTRFAYSSHAVAKSGFEVKLWQASPSPVLTAFQNT